MSNEINLGAICAELEQYLTYERWPWLILGLWVSSLINIGPMSVELEHYLTYECRACLILGLWVPSSIHLGPMGVELEHYLTYECRAWLIVGIWVSNSINLGHMSVELEQYSADPNFPTKQGCETTERWDNCILLRTDCTFTNILPIPSLPSKILLRLQW